MNRLTIIALALSALFHAAILHLMLPTLRKSSSDTLDLGQGTDIVLVEQGVAVDGLTKLGDAIDTVNILAVRPPDPSRETRPEALRDIVSSHDSEVEADVGVTQKALVPPEPDAVQAEEQLPPQDAIVAKESSGAAKTGADPHAVDLYLGQIYKHVERAKQSVASRRSGIVVMRFTIGLDGKLLSRQIASSSGSRVLDIAAEAALDRAAPFPPIPSKVSLAPITLTQQFAFEAKLLNGRSLRPRGP
jgi:periplasmic protein TonB